MDWSRLSGYRVIVDELERRWNTTIAQAHTLEERIAQHASGSGLLALPTLEECCQLGKRS